MFNRRRMTVVVSLVVGLSLAGAGVADAHKRRRPQPAQPASQPAETTRVVFETPLQDPSNFMNEGVGMYVDESTAEQLSTFTINKRMVSCGVGTLANQALGTTGPFAMLMYSTKIDGYNVDPGTKTITATGRMRSITKVAQPSGAPAEDVEHDFVAVAVDNPASGARDRFDVHFRTPMWNTGSPMCTPSSIVSGGCRFGGNALMGEIRVG